MFVVFSYLAKTFLFWKKFQFQLSKNGVFLIKIRIGKQRFFLKFGVFWFIFFREWVAINSTFGVPGVTAPLFFQNWNSKKNKKNVLNPFEEYLTT